MGVGGGITGGGGGIEQKRGKKSSWTTEQLPTSTVVLSRLTCGLRYRAKLAPSTILANFSEILHIAKKNTLGTALVNTEDSCARPC